jgi:hypothetical protein
MPFLFLLEAANRVVVWFLQRSRFVSPRARSPGRAAGLESGKARGERSEQLGSFLAAAGRGVQHGCGGADLPISWRGTARRQD